MRGLVFGLVLAGVLVGQAAACDDVECPDPWVWSDAEGTCVRVLEGLS